MVLKPVVVAVAVQQGVAADYAARRLHDIDRATHGNAQGTQLAVVAGGLNSHVGATERGGWGQVSRLTGKRET